MQGMLAALLLLTSAVILTSVVAGYAVTIFEQSIGTTNIPQLEQIRNIENNFLNQTDNLFNQV